MYSIHPSKELRRLFKDKPYQCQDPRKAKILFLGLDANFEPNIETSGYYKYIKEYLSNGIDFWNNYNVHHPFLLDSYPSSDGVRYHKQFSKLGLNSDYAKYISFVELLNIPTVGSTTKNISLFYQLLDIDYLNNFNDILLSKNKKLVFISSEVLRTLRKIKREYGIFNWIPDNEFKGLNKIQVVYNENGLKVCYMTHFSATISDNHIKDIRNTIDEFIKVT